MLKPAGAPVVADYYIHEESGKKFRHRVTGEREMWVDGYGWTDARYWPT